MFSSVTNFKLIFQPSSSALSHNCSPDIKEKVFFETKNNLASEEKNIAQINLGRNPFQRRKLIVKLFGLSNNRHVRQSCCKVVLLSRCTVLFSINEERYNYLERTVLKLRLSKKDRNIRQRTKLIFLEWKTRKCGDIITVYFFRRRVKNRQKNSDRY